MKFFSKIASLFMLAAAALTVSCSEIGSEESFDVPVDESRVISFSVKLPETTRGTGILNTTLTSFDIYATYSAYTTVSKKVMSVSTSGIWTLDGAMAMPADGSVTFYAVGSIGESDTSVSFNSTDKAITYTMNSDVTAQPTVVMAAPYTLAEDATSLSVEFAFDYVLAAVGFQAGDGDYDLTKVEMTNFYSSVDIAFADSYTTGAYTYGAAVTSSIYVSASVADDADNFFMIPAQDMKDAVVTAYFSYSDGSVVDTYTETYTLPANEDLKTLGMAYTYSVDSKTYDAAPEDLTPSDGFTSYDLGDILTGDSVTASATSTPSATITWSSEDTDIATVNPTTGVVTGVAGGKTNIVGTTANGGSITYSVEVWAKFLGYDVTSELAGATNSIVDITVSIAVDDVTTVSFDAIYGPCKNDNYKEPINLTSETVLRTYKDANNYITYNTNSSWNEDNTHLDIVITGVKVNTGVTNQIRCYSKGTIASTSCYSPYCNVVVVGEEEEETTTGSKFNYDLIFAGDYINSSGNVLTSSSGAIGMVYYVNASEGYALLVSPTCSKQSYWASTTTTKFGATNQECGYYNGATTYSGTAIGNIASAYAINKVWILGTVAAFLDDNDETKGQWYLPANQELAKMRTTSTLWSKIITYTSTSTYNVFWSSTEDSASNAYLTYCDIDSSDYGSCNKQRSTTLWPTRGLFRVMKF